MKTLSLVALLCCFSFIFEVKGQKEYPPHIDGAEEITYKTIDGTKLNLWIFTPEKHKSSDAAPAIVFSSEVDGMEEVRNNLSNIVNIYRQGEWLQ